LANPREQELDCVLASNAFGFCPGGAIAGLTVAAEALAPRAFLSEIDDDVAAVWKTIFGKRNADVEWLCERMRTFVVDAKAVDDVLRIKPRTMRGRAFKTIVRNRMSRGG